MENTIFKQAYESMLSHGGDGLSVIVCSNPEKTAKRCLKTLGNNCRLEFMSYPSNDNNSCWLTGDQEAICFCEDEPKNLPDCDEVFILKET